MIFFPQSKINLGLEVLKKRDDGYHEIQSCLFEIPLNDVIEILPASKFTFTIEGLSIPGNHEDNLCVKAYELMKEKYEVNAVEIILLKNIPMGAGLGGGSSDATAVITGLNDYFELNLLDEEMEALAAELGSDCPFFVKGGAQLATGRGEILSSVSVDLDNCWIQLINPGIHVSTAEAYDGVKFDKKSSLTEILEDRSRWKNELCNSFEEHIFKKHNSLLEIKNSFYENGAFYAAMSGSGSTMFGLFESEPESTGHENEWILKLKH